jgi:murein DD-endopeptidase MepM/ murein hydrolase activator NlpD
VQAFVTKDYQITDRSRYHPGLDLACAVGTPVLATGGGTVIYSGTDSVYGETIIVQHNDSVSTLYGHNDRLLAASGDRVEAGQQIAISGNTGRSTAPHVHYEIRIHDQPINPLENPYDQETR